MSRRMNWNIRDIQKPDCSAEANTILMFFRRCKINLLLTILYYGLNDRLQFHTNKERKLYVLSLRCVCVFGEFAARQ